MRSPGFQQARRDTIRGTLEAVYLLTKRAVEDGEPLEDVVVLLETVRHILEEKSP